MPLGLYDEGWRESFVSCICNIWVVGLYCHTVRRKGLIYFWGGDGGRGKKASDDKRTKRMGNNINIGLLLPSKIKTVLLEFGEFDK